MVRWLREAHLLLLLAFAAGSVDALSYLGLGRVFTANMTGNTVLLGVAVAAGPVGDALRALTALGGFCLGGAVGIAIIGVRRAPWHRLTLPVFGLETAALAALLAVWEIDGSSSLRYLLIVLSGVAMGAQSAATRVSTVPGVNTTYMTSTLLNFVARIVQRSPSARKPAEASRLPGAAWAIYALGALAGAGAQQAWDGGAVAIPLAIVVAVTSLGWLSPRPEEAALAGPEIDQPGHDRRA